MLNRIFARKLQMEAYVPELQIYCINRLKQATQVKAYIYCV